MNYSKHSLLLICYILFIFITVLFTQFTFTVFLMHILQEQSSMCLKWCFLFCFFLLISLLCHCGLINNLMFSHCTCILFRTQLTPQGPKSFGLLFDIDGVLVRGRTPIPAAKQCFRKLVDRNGKYKVPVVFVTNAGNCMRQAKAEHLSHLLDVEVNWIFHAKSCFAMSCVTLSSALSFFFVRTPHFRSLRTR